MKKIALITILLSISLFTKSQSYSSDRVVLWENKQIIEEKFKRVEIDIMEDKKLIYINWLDDNSQWPLDIVEKDSDSESVSYNCTGASGNQVILLYYKPDNEYVLMLDEMTQFVFQHIKKK
jgi:hypothetical protein